ncbi:MAG TPA: PTS sugar transporter subunit IIA [Devosiaceae bacterium]|jgi:PTS system nitrogen regulatory IIA component
MKITDFLQPGDVLVDLAIPSKQRLLQILSEKAGAALRLDGVAILAALNKREELGSTGIGQGIAIPHTSPAGLAKPFGLLARLAKPLDFNAIDEKPVDIVFLLLSPDDRSVHLAVLSAVARRLRSADIQRALRSARTADQAYAAMTATAE